MTQSIVKSNNGWVKVSIDGKEYWIDPANLSIEDKTIKDILEQNKFKISELNEKIYGLNLRIDTQVLRIQQLEQQVKDLKLGLERTNVALNNLVQELLKVGEEI